MRFGVEGAKITLGSVFGAPSQSSLTSAARLHQRRVLPPDEMSVKHEQSGMARVLENNGGVPGSCVAC